RPRPCGFASIGVLVARGAAGARSSAREKRCMNDAVDPCFLSAARAAQLIAARKLSALELADALLARIAQREPQVCAWVSLDPDQVRAAARACDATPAAGPLHGVPIGIKDVIATRDLPTQYNSP